MKKYYLVPDGEAGEIERLTGLRGRNTPFGALVEQPDERSKERLGIALAAINRAFNPPSRGCPECGGIIMHTSKCKLAAVT